MIQPYAPFPKPQCGNSHVGQSRQRPPCPNFAISGFPIFSPAKTLGRIKSKIVFLWYIPQAGTPKIGISPL